MVVYGKAGRLEGRLKPCFCFRRLAGNVGYNGCMIYHHIALNVPLAGGLLTYAHPEALSAGTRVAVHRGEVFDLGIPATIAMTPIETVAGYRFGGPRARILPYAGGGLGWVRYQETSSFATDAESWPGYCASTWSRIMSAMVVRTDRLCLLLESSFRSTFAT